MRCRSSEALSFRATFRRHVIEAKGQDHLLVGKSSLLKVRENLEGPKSRKTVDGLCPFADQFSTTN